ncbi:MAG: hypothetical protein ACFWUC_02960 [Oscillospiraceae bacterium]|jgi:uncharacterized repeat protein (TIGR02543 family)
MSKKVQKYIVVLFTVFLSTVLLTMTAYAQQGIPREDESSSSDIIVPTEGQIVVWEENTSLQGDSSYNDEENQENGGEEDQGIDDENQEHDNDTVVDDEENQPNDDETPVNGEENQDNPDSEVEVSPGMDGTGNVDVPQDNASVSVKLDYNDGNGIRVVNVEPGTLVQDLPTPSRDGYVFDYWTVNGTQVSPTFQIYSEMTLTAQWTQVSESSSAKPSSYASVDTHQQEIERAASQAQAATSDPDVLSSEDWESILSTESQLGSAAGVASEQTSSAASQGGGSSWLFPLGITLIVLSACGIGTFIYLQFFSDPGPRGRGPRTGRDDYDGMEFIDISSHSETPHDSTKPSQTPRRSSDNEDTMPIPHQVRQIRQPSSQDSARLQTRPSAEKKKEFDWDKFFNDDI